MDTLNVQSVEAAVKAIEANKRFIATALAEYTDDEELSPYKKRILIAVGEGKIDSLNLALRLIKEHTKIEGQCIWIGNRVPHIKKKVKE